MFAEWNSGHLFRYNGLSQNAQIHVFVDCTALRFIMKVIFKPIKEVSQFLALDTKPDF